MLDDADAGRGGVSGSGGGAVASAGKATATGGAGSAGAASAGAASAGISGVGVAGAAGALGQGGAGGEAEPEALDWPLELELIPPPDEHVAIALEEGDVANSGALAFDADATHALAYSAFPDRTENGDRLYRWELTSWTRGVGSVSLGSLPDIVPTFNSDGNQFSVMYRALAWTRDLKVLVGSVDGSDGAHAFVWREGQGMSELALPSSLLEVGVLLSDDGQTILVVARDSAQIRRTYRFDAQGRSDLGTLGGFDNLAATYLSPDGNLVIGSASKSGCDSCALPFRVQLGGEPQAFELPTGVHDCSTADSWWGGRRLGLSCATSEPDSRAIWADGVGWRELSGLPGSGHGISLLSRDGSAVIGRSQSPASVWHWDSQAGVTVLPLPEGTHLDALNAVSDDAGTAILQIEDANYRRRTLLWRLGAPPEAVAGPKDATWPMARYMSDDATRMIGTATAKDRDKFHVLWVDGRASFIEDLFAASGIDLSGIDITDAAVSGDGRLLYGSANVGRAQRTWVSRLP